MFKTFGDIASLERTPVELVVIGPLDASYFLDVKPASVNHNIRFKGFGFKIKWQK